MCPAVSDREGIRPEPTSRVGGEDGEGDKMPEEETAIRDEDEEVSEEARDMVSKKVCAAPTAEEVRVHRLTHVPYRAWCPECVAAKGVDDPHRPRGLEFASEFPEVHFDYCFLRDQKGAPSVTVIVGKDRRTRSFLGHVVPGKGVKSRWIPQCIERETSASWDIEVECCCVATVSQPSRIFSVR